MVFSRAHGGVRQGVQGHFCSWSGARASLKGPQKQYWKKAQQRSNANVARLGYGVRPMNMEMQVGSHV